MKRLIIVKKDYNMQDVIKAVEQATKDGRGVILDITALQGDEKCVDTFVEISSIALFSLDSRIGKCYDFFK